MTRTTYRGRPIKILAVRGKPHHRKLVINDQVINHAWHGDDAQALDWFHRIIDRLDASGGPGNSAYIVLGYTNPHWWEPGTFDINPASHVTQPGGFCLCSQCIIGDVGGGKARYSPLQPDACRYCHQGPDNHDPRPLSVSGPHQYTEPTPIQRAGREATLRLRKDTGTDEPPECGAKYHKDVPNYLTRPRCGLLADHRDAAGTEDRHQDMRGFSWPREEAIQ